jgi:hypothetical protein
LEAPSGETLGSDAANQMHPTMLEREDLANFEHAPIRKKLKSAIDIYLDCHQCSS